MKKPRKARRAPVARTPREPRLSRTLAPANLPLVQWQRILRRQFGREQAFLLENLGTERFFSEFRVSNPQSKASCRVAIRGVSPGDNRCTCPVYATNELGTCKHIEFVLARLETKHGAKAAFARGYQPPFSELTLRNEGGRAIHFRAGTECPAAVLKAARSLFDVDRGWRLPPERLGDLERFITAVHESGNELQAHDDALDFVAGRRDAERRAAILDAMLRGGSGVSMLKKLLKVPLYPYQAEGVLFAVRAGAH